MGGGGFGLSEEGLPKQQSFPILFGPFPLELRPKIIYRVSRLDPIRIIILLGAMKWIWAFFEMVFWFIWCKIWQSTCMRGKANIFDDDKFEKAAWEEVREHI